MHWKKATKFRADKVSIVGHYEDQETPRGNRGVWVPDHLIVECGCGKKMRASDYPNLCECGASHETLVRKMKPVLGENIPLTCRDQKGGRLTRVVYEASEIVQALTQKAPPHNGVGSLFSLEDAVVVGKFDLKHCTIERPLEVRNCWFLESLDLRYCEFKHAVYFLDCIFYREFNSGDTTESHTVYRKELNCSRSYFKRAASFNGVQVVSSAYFHGSRFELKEPEKSSKYPSLSAHYAVDFATASFGCHIECGDAVFEGPVRFNSVSCNGNGLLGDAYFEEKADFTAASFGRNLECPGAKFGGLAYFNSVKCDGNGIFDGACFEEKADFIAATFGRNLQCTETKFKGPANFNSLRCSGAWIARRVLFGDEVNLRFSSFGLALVCQDSKFWGKVDCSAMKCAHDGLFTNSRFESHEEVVFAGANIGGDLRCECTVFKGTVNFKRLRCDGAGRFQNATFIGIMDVYRYPYLADFRYSYFGGDLDLRGAYFAGKVGLARLSSRNRLRLGAACFRGKVDLYASQIRILELIDPNYPLPRDALEARTDARTDALEARIMEKQDEFAMIVEDKKELERILRKAPLEGAASKLKIGNIQQRERARRHMVEGLFPFGPSSLNLSDTSFELFHGGPSRELTWELALRLSEGQDPTTFSRDPYLQLEKYYSSIGEEDDALDIHYRGHCALRENAKASRNESQKGRVNWPWAKIWVTDFIWKWTTGYGQKMYRLLLLFSFFVTTGTIAFWSDKALTLTPGAAGSVQAQQGWPKLIDRIVFSIDLLIPVLDLRAGDTRIADSSWWFYEVVHIFAGWLLVALLIAWITAIARGNR